MIFDKNEFSKTLNQFFISSSVVYIGGALTSLMIDSEFVAGIIGIAVFAAGIYNLVLLKKFGNITNDPTIKKVFMFNIFVIIIPIIVALLAMGMFGVLMNTGEFTGGVIFLALLIIVLALALIGLGIAAHIMTVNFIKKAVPTDKIENMSKTAITLFVGALIAGIVLSLFSVPVVGSLLTLVGSAYYIYYLYTANEEVKTITMIADEVEEMVENVIITPTEETVTQVVEAESVVVDDDGIPEIVTTEADVDGE